MSIKARTEKVGIQTSVPNSPALRKSLLIADKNNNSSATLSRIDAAIITQLFLHSTTQQLQN